MATQTSSNTTNIEDLYARSNLTAEESNLANEYDLRTTEFFDLGGFMKSYNDKINTIRAIIIIKKIRQLSKSELKIISSFLRNSDEKLFKQINNLPPATILDFLNGLPLNILDILRDHVPMVLFEYITRVEQIDGYLREINEKKLLDKIFTKLDISLISNIFNILNRLRHNVTVQFMDFLLDESDLSRRIRELQDDTILKLVNGLPLNILRILQTYVPIVQYEIMTHLNKGAFDTFFADIDTDLIAKISLQI